MSAQINLYHPRFLKQSDSFSLGNLAIVAAVLYGLLAAVAAWAWQDARLREDAARGVEAQVKAVKDMVTAEAKASATRKPSPQLGAELARGEAVLRRSGEIARLLESGAVGSTGGFAEYLRGFSRQTPEGLWLTGFNIGAGGSDIEIRGSLLDPAVLPDYIRRLGGEKAFQGRSFAALTMTRAEPAAAVRPVAQAVGVSPAPTPGPRPIDFVLLPRLVDAKEAKP